MPSIVKNSRRIGVSLPGDQDQWVARAWRFYAAGRHEEAVRLCRRLTRDDPGCGLAWHIMGLVKRDQGNAREGIGYLEKAVGAEPDQPIHLNSMAVILMDLKAYRDAAVYLEKALALSPDYFDAAANLGLVRFYQNQPDLALACFQQVLSRNPRHSNALANSGMVHAALGNLQEAVTAYEQALAIQPAQPKWLGNLGAAGLCLGRYDRAVACFQTAATLSPRNPAFYIGLGSALRSLNDWSGSLQALGRAYQLAPEDGSVLANLAAAYQHTCQWDELPRVYEKLDGATRSALARQRKPDEQPLLSIRRTFDGELNLAVARAWSRSAVERALTCGPPFEHRRPPAANDVITLGYLSYDFRDHPVAHQLAPLFRRHDRRRFKVIAFSMGPDDHSAFRRDIQAHCDEFVDISGLGLARAAETIHQRKVDILIDLMGHTLHNRLEIPARRPAPLQVGYLGFLASTGADFIDYLITDGIVVPPEHERFYSEKLIRLPHCYQMNHRPSLNGLSREHRTDWGLPEQGVVFCSFNQAYKLDADLFAVWMRILDQVPGSVLWMGRDNPMAEEELGRRARRCGIDARRLVFADKVSLPRHLNRLKLADLALDTVMYNGGATTANALCAGVPVLTVRGGHWVSRMSASHLAAAGMAELAVADLAAYERLAVDLATRPGQRQRLRDRLNPDPPESDRPPLFRTGRFVRHYEQALETIWRRYRDHLPPEHITIADSTGRTAAPPEDSPAEPSASMPASMSASMSVHGLHLLNQGRHREAVDALEQAVSANPSDYATLNNLGLAYHRAGQWDRAIAAFRRVLEIHPAFVKAFYNLGNVYMDRKDTGAMVQCYRDALALTPDDPQAHYRMGQLYLEHLDADQARHHFQRAVDLAPDNADARVSLGTTALMQGDYQTGWPLYHWRFKTAHHQTRIHPYQYPWPLWKGQSYPGKRLLVYGEQGLGDTIQFARFLPRAKALGGELNFLVQPALMPLFADAPYIDALHPLTDAPPADINADLCIPLLDLPACLNIDAGDIPMNGPYIQADQRRTDRWAKHFDPQRFNIGVVWSGNPLFIHNPRRSCRPERFVPLGRLASVQLYTLQKEVPLDDKHMLTERCGAEHLGEYLTCFGETAAVIECLHLVITVCTSVAHLAGAMGKPVWLLLHQPPDWRWQLKGSATPWYPRMRLFRQAAAGDWDAVFAALRAALRAALPVEIEAHRGAHAFR